MGEVGDAATPPSLPRKQRFPLCEVETWGVLYSFSESYKFSLGLQLTIIDIVVLPVN